MHKSTPSNRCVTAGHIVFFLSNAAPSLAGNQNVTYLSSTLYIANIVVRLVVQIAPEVR
jgi:hypothetical protein